MRQLFFHIVCLCKASLCGSLLQADLVGVTELSSGRLVQFHLSLGFYGFKNTSISFPGMEDTWEFRKRYSALCFRNLGSCNFQLQLIFKVHVSRRTFDLGLRTRLVSGRRKCFKREARDWWDSSLSRSSKPCLHTNRQVSRSASKGLRHSAARVVERKMQTLWTRRSFSPWSSLGFDQCQGVAVCINAFKVVARWNSTAWSGRRSEEHLLVTIPSLPIGPIRRVLAKTYWSFLNMTHHGI